MKRLFRISLDILVTSISPIIAWFLLGVILDNKLVNIFSLTYPLQCLTLMIVSIFGTGANICIYRDKNKNAGENGIIYGTIFSTIVFGVIALNSDKYISFMNMDIVTYKTLGIYSIIQMLFHTILQLILSKLYFREENKKANKIAILYNIINFVTLISTSIITRSQIITSTVTTTVMFLVISLIFIKSVKRFDFKLNFKNCIKYNSVSFSLSWLYFLTYLFGFSNSFEYGEKYMVAITFATLITDTQWDITDAEKTVAKIDIVKGKFNYKEHHRNALKLNSLLILSVIIMALIAYPFYKPDIKIVSIFISLHILDFIIEPFMLVKTCYLQLEDSAVKMTTNMIIAFIIRTLMALAPTPYCTIIGQMCSTAYELICTKINYRKYESKNCNPLQSKIPQSH